MCVQSQLYQNIFFFYTGILNEIFNIMFFILKSHFCFAAYIYFKLGI